MSYLLETSDRIFGIELHSDPLCILPAALSKKRAFKKNKVQYDELKDYSEGQSHCPFCFTQLLDGQPEVTTHLAGKVISFPNAAPFLPGDPRVFCLWHESEDTRRDYVHKFKFQDFGIEEFYYMLLAVASLAKEFPDTPAATMLQGDLHLTRCIAGFNIGRLAGQSVPHFHLQYGWEIYLNMTAKKGITPELLALFYSELQEKGLVLYDHELFYIIVPWTPKGQFHIEVHFKKKYELSHLKENDIQILSFLSKFILKKYNERNIKNVNILFSGSPHGKMQQPLVVQFIPRVNMIALYEMIGVNVVDTFPEEIAHFFQSGFRWEDVVLDSKKKSINDSYIARFGKNPNKSLNPTA